MYINGTRIVNKNVSNPGKWIMRFISVVAIVALTCGGCQYLNQKFGLEPDNQIEEAFENLLEKQTGLDLDFTPGTPEK
jgi:hypothetical protein